MKKIFAVFGLIFLTVRAFPESATVAVLPFANTRSDASLSFLEETLSGEALAAYSRFPTITLIERSRIDAVLKEMELSQSGLTDGSAYNLLRADYLFAGNFSGSSENLSVHIRVIEARTGRVQSAVVLQGPLSAVIPGVRRYAATSAQILSGAPAGSLSIESNPSRAQILIDGLDYGSTPLAELLLPEGAYHLSIVRDDFQTWKREIKMEQGKKVELTAELIPARSAATVFVMPYAGIFVPTAATGVQYGFEYGGTIGSRIQDYLLGFSYSYAPTFDHSYEYQVPYNTYTELRFYDVHRFSFLGGFTPLEFKLVSLGIGIDISASFVTDYLLLEDDAMENDVTKTEKLESAVLYGATPLIFAELFPNSYVSAFATLGYQFGLNAMDREITEQIAISGIETTKIESMRADGLRATLGIKFNFQ